MGLKIVKLTGTTNSSGAATINHDTTVTGRLYAVDWIDGDLADGVDAVLSVQNVAHGAAAVTLLTLTDANDDARYYPRHQVHSNAGAALTLDGTRIAYDLPVISGLLRLVIADGGDTKTGGAVVYVLEP